MIYLIKFKNGSIHRAKDIFKNELNPSIIFYHRMNQGTCQAHIDEIVSIKEEKEETLLNKKGK